MSKFIGVDTSNIDNVSGFFVTQGGGISPVPATTDSGVLLCPYNVQVARPWSAATFEDYQNPVHMFQLADFTGVKKIANSIYHMGILLNNGNLYTSGYTNSAYFGLSSADAIDAVNNGNFNLSLSNVKTFGCTIQGFMAIKNDGTLWFVGSVSNYLNSAGLGGGSTISTYGWTQIGTDIDGVAFVDQSGYSVSLSNNGTVVAVGAIGNDDNGTDAGQVRVFEYSSGSWNQMGSDILGDAAGDKMGYGVSLSSDGLTCAVGAMGNQNKYLWSRSPAPCLKAVPKFIF